MNPMMMKKIQKMQRDMVKAQQEIEQSVEMLEDVILLALNDALRQVDEKTESTMGQFTKGMNIPGLF